ncbi:Pheromone-binding protein-related protein 6 [Frankliniella fusca]|uniref:Pheromone-binding protein-related protein 6 n=1 Tax=Frankliniella fusca TaxID=407009 RepID=A0AAE1HT16_9NEOP|nr:Pheromone-binding protein-related protein 6 [Frankliniella fusca]
MQLALVAAAMTTLLATVRTDESAMQAVMKCAKDSNMKLEVLMKSCDSDMSGVDGFKCFTKCVQQLMGIMGEDGKFSPEGATKFVADEDRGVALKVANECAKEVGDTPDLCERAHAVNECSKKKDPEIYKKSCLALMAKMMS